MPACVGGAFHAYIMRSGAAHPSRSHIGYTLLPPPMKRGDYNMRGGAGDRHPQHAQSIGPQMTCHAPTMQEGVTDVCSCYHDRPTRARVGIIPETLPNFYDNARLLVQTL